MRKSLNLVCLTLLLSPVITVAQEGAGADKQTTVDRKEQLEAEKIALITKELGLTSEQAKVFWPVHEEYEAAVKALRKDKKGEDREAGKGDQDEDEKIAELSDDEAKKLIEEEFAFKDKELALQKSYFQKKFPAVISLSQTARLFKMEDKWKKMLLKKMRDERAGGGPGAQRPERPERPERPDRPVKE